MGVQERIINSGDQEKEILSLPTGKGTEFIGRWTDGDRNLERKYAAYQRYHAGGTSRWKGERVVTGQGKKNAQLTKDTM
jgi:hypothetical protein